MKDGRAEKAGKIEEIREALGIKIADNLVGAYVVLLVEGEEDRDILTTWLKLLSPALKSAMDKHLLIVDHLGGATNLHYKTSFYKQNVYNIHAFMDNDDDGRNAIESVISRNMLTQADYNLSVCTGMKDSELEDLFSFESYAAIIHQKYGVQISPSQFKNSKGKWSDRIKKAFDEAGKQWNKSLKMQVKRSVVDVCIKSGISSLAQHRRKPLDNLILSLESKMAVYKN